MNSTLNLKEIEKRAFRSTYQDGLWDIYYGLVVISMAFFMYHPKTGYSWINIAMMVGSLLIAYSLFYLGKKFITIPRLGQAVFGEVRKQKKRRMIFMIMILVAFQVLLLLATAFGWKLGLFDGSLNEHLLVSLIASLIVYAGMSIITYMSDFLRGFYISFLMALTVFLMVYFNQIIFAIAIGVVIAIPGIVLLIRFVNRYPKTTIEDPHV